MSKLFTLCLALFTFCSSAYSQQKKSLFTPQDRFNNSPVITKVNANHLIDNSADYAMQKNGLDLMAAGDTILYEDFASGVPADWSNSGTGNEYVWTYTTTGPSQLSSYAIKSSTKSNGWVMVDAYLDPTPLGSGIAMLTTSALDCSNRTSVLLQFQEYFYQLNRAKISVEVSTDSSNWTSYEVNPDFSGNQVSLKNPNKIKINLTDVAAGQSKVYIRFQWDNTLSSGALNVFWQIDDILITEADTNNLSLNEVFTLSDHFFGDYYSMTPLDQESGRYYYGKVVNNGAATQTDVTFNASFELNTSEVYSELSASQNMTAAQTDTTELTSTSYFPTDIGEYEANFWVDQTETDDDTTDNYFSFDFEVSDTVFARDNSSAYINDGPYWNGEAEMEIGNVFTITNDAEVTSASLYVGDGSETNSSFYFNLYELDVTDFTASLLYSSDLFILTSNTQDKKWQTITFADPQFLPAGYYVLTVYLIDDDPTNGTMFAGSSLMSFLPNGLNNSFTFIDGELTYWYGNFVPMVRMNFGVSSGINDAITDKVILNPSNPNPANQSTVISYSLKQAAKEVVLAISDISGKLIMSLNEGSKAKGSNSINVNTENIAAGTYFYTLKVDGEKATGKMTVAH
jgi:hypothetical protein